ncbi:MAG: glycosyltransferase family 9 protein [Nitrospirae bacterium]|nr:glycosyltransferase family 9 protein [Nitrospirota bacterium]
MELHHDCRHFVGYIPCRPHKAHGVHCSGCKYYDATDYNILIIKLGAIGDVIRTTPLLHRLKAEHPGAYINWLTLTPEVLPGSVDRKLGFNLKDMTTLMGREFDLLINLDKDYEACSLAASIPAKVKMGFTLVDGKPRNIDDAAYHKYLTGLFDDVNKANTQSYPEEIFDICGYRFAGEKYILELPAEKPEFGLPDDARIVGLNTGCGGRWVTRLWPDDRWVALAKGLREAGYWPLFLGGEAEHEKNARLAELSGADYLGHYSLQEFFCLVDKCELVVTAVTMGLHIAIGLGKKVVLFNNIFNPHEFEMYGLGTILSPGIDCEGCFRPTCAENCMEKIAVGDTLEAVKRLMAQEG